MKEAMDSDQWERSISIMKKKPEHFANSILAVIQSAISGQIIRKYPDNNT
jgi:hypothetical protein